MSQRVLLFLPMFGSGGCEAFVVNVAIALKDAGWKPSILSIDEGETIYDGRLESAGIERSVLLPEGLTNPAALYLRAYRAWAKFLNANKGRFDVIHFNIAQGEELPLVWMAKRAGVPVRVLHSHNSQTNSRIKYLGHVACKLFFQGVATDYVSCSDVAAAWNLPERIVADGRYALMNNGIDTEAFRFDPGARARKRSELGIVDRHVYLNVGRLHRQKNQSFLLDAFAEVAKTDPDATLLVVGTGELGADLKEKAHSHDLGERVRWLGARTDVAELYWAADVFLLPSLYEGFPFTLIEAQAAGLPCVVSKSVSQQCAITDNCVFEPLDIHTFAAAAIRATSIVSDRREMRCDEVAAKGYDIRSTVEQLLEIYEGGHDGGLA